MSCEDFSKMTEPYIDAELERGEKEAYEKHIKECASCREELEFARSVRKSLSDMGKPNIPKDFFSQIEKKLESDEKGEEKPKRNFFHFRIYTAVAACLLIAAVLSIKPEDNTDRKFEKILKQETVTNEELTNIQAEDDNTSPEVKAAGAQEEQKENKSQTEKEPKKTPNEQESPVFSHTDEEIRKNAARSDNAKKDATEEEQQDSNDSDMSKNASLGKDNDGEVKIDAKSLSEAQDIAANYGKNEDGIYKMSNESFKEFLSELEENEIEYSASVDTSDAVSFEINDN